MHAKNWMEAIQGILQILFNLKIFINNFKHKKKTALLSNGSTKSTKKLKQEELISFFMFKYIPKE